MSWLERLKNHRMQAGKATEPTKPGSVGFVAPVPGVSEIPALTIVPPRLRAASPANAETLPTAIDRDCINCLHLLRHGTCGDPVGAGLVPNFGIVWPPDGHASGCAAFSGLAPVKKQDRPYRLMTERADRCHTQCWDTAEIARFEARQARFIRFGLADQDADDLAEALILRDRDGDDRHMCRECRELTQAGRCSAATRGDMPGVGRQMEPVPDILMRCASFKPAVSAHRESQGTEHASHHD